MDTLRRKVLMRQAQFHYPQGLTLLAKRHVSPSLIIKLPPELRNHIYLLVMNDIKQVTFPLNAHLPRVPPLLQVCNEIRTEASGLLWSLNTFIFSVGTNLIHRQPHHLLTYHDRMNKASEIRKMRRAGRLELHPTTLACLRSLKARWRHVILRIYDMESLKVLRAAVKYGNGYRRGLRSGNASEVINTNVPGWMCELHFRNRHGLWAVDLVFPAHRCDKDVVLEAVLLQTVNELKLGFSRMTAGWAVDHALGIEDLEHLARVFRCNIDPMRLQ